MTKKHDAFKDVMGELQDRIRYHSTRRLHRDTARPHFGKAAAHAETQDPTHGGQHEEPDGDEDAQGNEPEGPEETRYGHGLKAIEGDFGGHSDEKMEGLERPASEPKWKREVDEGHHSDKGMDARNNRYGKRR